MMHQHRFIHWTNIQWGMLTIGVAVHVWGGSRVCRKSLCLPFNFTVNLILL